MSEYAEAALAELAVDFWKLVRAFNRTALQLDEAQSRRAAAQSRFSAGRLDAHMERAGLRLVIYDGQALGPGLPVSALNANDISGVENAIVLETIEPAVLAGERVIRAGRVMGGRQMYLGIDLGTSNSAVVGNANGVLRLFKTTDGRDVLPSVIYADRRGARFVGTRAYDKAQSAPSDVAQGFKRLMGTSSELSLEAAGITLTPEEASSEIIQTLIAQVRAAAGDVDFEGVIVTIPAAFNQMQSEATLRAASLAGLERVGLIQEPVAAAMSALEGATRRDGRFLVYDLGGGTFDVALVESLAGNVNVIAHEGVNMLGGRDFDRVVLDSVVRPWLADNFTIPSNPHSDPAYKRLFDIARARSEQAKIELSTRQETTVFVADHEARVNDLDGQAIYIDATVSRSDFQRLIAERVDESIALCRKLLADNGLTHEDVDRIVFIGGPSNTPSIRERVPVELGIPADLSADPMTAVARGAAIFAESREWEAKSTRRKAQRAATSAGSGIDLRYEYTARVADEVGRIRIRVGENSGAAGIRVRLTGPDGQDTGDIPVNGMHDETVRLPLMGENKFVARVTATDGTQIGAEQTLTITRVHASASTATAASTISVKVVAGPSSAPYNRLEPIVPKGTPLPSLGSKEFASKRELIAGTPGVLDIELFNHREGVDDPALNLWVGSMQLKSDRDLIEGDRLPLGSPVHVHWEMDDNGIIKIEVEFPDLQMRLDSKNFYVPQAGHRSFDGDDGQALAASSLAAAEASLAEAEGVLGATAKKKIGQLRLSLDRHKELLENSADAEARRSVTEQARHIQQEVACLYSEPEHRRIALLAEIEKIEESFADFVELAKVETVQRMNALGRSAREALAREDWDRGRQVIEEMRSLTNRTMSEDPRYWLAFLKRFSDERFAALDKHLHDRLVQDGVKAVEAEDMDEIRRVVIDMARNRLASANDSDVAELAGLSVF